MKIRSGLTGLAVTAAALLGLSTPVREASSTAHTAAIAEQRPAMLIDTQIPSERHLNDHQATAAGADSASLVIQEAHSDGGYSYWRSGREQASHP